MSEDKRTKYHREAIYNAIFRLIEMKDMEQTSNQSWREKAQSMRIEIQRKKAVSKERAKKSLFVNSSEEDVQN